MTFAQALALRIEHARLLHPKPAASEHEALAFLLEEVDELKAEIFRKNSNPAKVLSELLDVATICQRFAEEVLFRKLNDLNLKEGVR